MKITPLVLFAAMRVPALTSVFSDALAVASITVNHGGNVVLVTSAEHGIAVGEQTAVSIVDAYQPNAITAWSKVTVPSGAQMVDDVVLTLTYPHSLTTTPDATNFVPWNSFALISGTGVSGLDGNKQLVAVPNDMTIVIRPGGLSLPGSIPVGSVLLERLETDIVGWHAVTATDATTLVFPTPSGVSRSYAIANPNVVTNMRTWGAVDLQHAMTHFARDDETVQAASGKPLGQSYLFICPPRTTQLSRDRKVSSDALVENTPGTFIREHLIDGFIIYAVLPAEQYGSAVACMDMAHGSILTAVLRTFNGLRLPFTELAAPNPFLCQLTSHGVARYDRANYVHHYTFQCTAYLTNGDTVAQTAVPDFVALDQAILNGVTPTDIPPAGSVPMTTISFDQPYGIFQKDQPQPLHGTVRLDYQP